jgi:hypothetical protein
MQSFFLVKMNIFMLRCEWKFASPCPRLATRDNSVDKQWISGEQMVNKAAH